MDSNTELAAVEHEMPNADQLREFGYWPGGYIIGCRDCKERIWHVAKRAWRCEPCAIGAFQQAALTQQPADHIPDASNMVPAEQIADGALGVTLDWRVVAKSAGTNGIRYRTNTALLHFLAEIMPLAQQARAQALEEAAKAEPSEAMWGGLARDIMMWLDFGGPSSRTPRALFRHLKMSGRAIPQWLRDEPEMRNLDHVPSKGTRCVIIWKAMQEDAIRALQPHGQGGGE